MKKKIDWLLLSCVLLLSGIGVLFIYSTTYYLPSQTLVIKQILWIIVGVIALLGILNIEIENIERYSFYFFIFVILLLLIVLLKGERIHGTRAWIRVGSVSFQPSEFAKLAIILILAYFLKYNKGDSHLFFFIKFIGISSIPIFLILLEPDIGTALIFFPIIIGMGIIGGIKSKYFLHLFLVSILFSPFIWKYGLKEYQRKRIVAFINPKQHSISEAYQLMQSKIALGSGGIFGKGIKKGTQNMFGFLPEKSTDFIFAVIGEETGFVGILVVIFLFTFLFVCIAETSIKTKDPFNRLVCCGILLWFFSQFFINTAVVTGIFPTTGIPLPFISYGGSSVVACMIGIGIIMNIRTSMHRYFYREVEEEW